MEFFIAILLIFTPDGRVAMETLAFETYAECRRVTEAAAQEARAKLPGFDVRTACISTDKISAETI